MTTSVLAKEVLIGDYFDIRLGDRIAAVRIEKRIDSGIWEASVDGKRIVTVVLRDLIKRSDDWDSLPSDPSSPAPSSDSPPRVDSKRAAAGDID